MSEEVYSDKAPSRPGEWTFRDYTTFMSPRQAMTILVALAVTFLACEVFLRIKPPAYERATQNSMYGIREQLLNLTTDPRPKVIGVGDSTFIGAGVRDTSKTTMGLVRSYFGQGAYVANLSLPNGDNLTSLMVLKSLKKLGVSNVKDIIIEVLRAKFMVTPQEELVSYYEAAKELQRFNPESPTDRAPYKLSRQEATEATLEWDLSKISAVYRYKDYLRNHKIGMYPAFYVVGALAPKSVLKKLLGPKGDGNNRLSAHVDDRPYALSDGAPSEKTWRFEHGDEVHLFEDCLRAAEDLHPEKIIVLAMPEHYTYDQLSPSNLAKQLHTLAVVDGYLKAVCTAKNMTVVTIPSEDYQQRELWTRTAPHFRPALHTEVFNRLKPSL